MEILIAILVYITTGLVQFKLKNDLKFNATIFMNFVATLLLSSTVIKTIIYEEPLELCFNCGNLIQDVALRVDTLSAFFILVIGVISFLGSVYAKGYLKPYVQKGKDISSHLFLFNLFISSMILVCMSQNILFFLLSWELMSFSSFLLMMFEHEERDVRKASINYLVTMHIGVVLLTIGFILLYIKTGSLDFNSFKGNINDLVFILMFLGFGVKAGVIPVHTWLPKAHPAAPTHVSGLMSGVMIKTGIYGILRILFLMGKPTLEVSYLVLIIGLLSAFFGILYSVAQRNYKKMLAYSSIENIGIITTSLGVGMLGLVYENQIMSLLGFIGCFMHILNHSIFKTLLFFCVGAIYNKAHTKDMEKLGGLVHSMKYTSVAFLIGALAISALPPFNGFISEFIIYFGFLKSFETQSYALFLSMVASIGVLAFVGAMALVSFTNAYSIIFLGSPRTEKAEHVKNDASKLMLIPIYILVGLIIFIGLFPQYAVKLPLLIANNFVDLNLPMNALVQISKFNITAVLLCTIIFGIRGFLLKGKTIEHKVTWGCGYQHPTSRMQYTSNSYTRPFLGFLTPFFLRTLDFETIKEYFPKTTYFKSKISDIFDYYIIKPITMIDEFIISKFYWIQGGQTQIYLIYGVVFLFLAIILIIGGKI